MRKPVDSSVQIHPLLADRWSPRSLDPSAQISKEELTGLIEAARWAPSANNFQPWRFIVTSRGEANFNLISETLSGFNKSWAPNAAAYIVVLSEIKNSAGETNPYADYDSGIAAGMLTVEAHHRGFVIHQMAGFDKDKFVADFKIPDSLKPIAVIAVGKQAPADALSEAVLLEREKAPRIRKSLSEIVIA